MSTPNGRRLRCGHLESWKLNLPKALSDSLNEQDMFLPWYVGAFHLKLERATLHLTTDPVPFLQLGGLCERGGRQNSWVTID